MDTEGFHPVIPVADLQPNTRPRANLRLWQVLPALALAPLLGSVVMTLLIDFILSIVPEEGESPTSGDLTIVLFTPSLWSLACGLGYLMTVTRARDQITRRECLFLGCVSGTLTPIALAIASALYFRGELPPLGEGAIAFLATIGLFAAPFGLFGGWVFWRFGVSPASITQMPDARVFD